MSSENPDVVVPKPQEPAPNNCCVASYRKTFSEECRKNTAYWGKIVLSVVVILVCLLRLVKGDPSPVEQTVLYSLIAFAVGSFAPNPKYSKLVEIVDDIRKGDVQELVSDAYDIFKPTLNPTPPVSVVEEKK